VAKTVTEEKTPDAATSAGEFNEEAATIAATRPVAPEPEKRISALMDDLTEVMGDAPAKPTTDGLVTDLQETESCRVLEPTEGFLARAAAGGGGDVIQPAQPAAPATAAYTEEPVPEEKAQPFLRQVGTRNIEQVDTPEWPAPRASVNRSVAAGIGPDNPKDDLMAPAYTRKYMD
jgi:hypothetical protein